MAPKPYHVPPRTPGPPSTGRPATKKGTPTQAAPARNPFPPKTTTPEKMKNGPKAKRSK